MAFEIEYFHERVRAEIESWPVDVLADCARLIELLIEHGPSLRLPHSRALGEGLFESRPHGRSMLGRDSWALGRVAASQGLLCTQAPQLSSSPQGFGRLPTRRL
jgi:hypothetical protein